MFGKSFYSSFRQHRRNLSLVTLQLSPIVITYFDSWYRKPCLWKVLDSAQQFLRGAQGTNYWMRVKRRYWHKASTKTSLQNFIPTILILKTCQWKLMMSQWAQKLASARQTANAIGSKWKIYNSIKETRNEITFRTTQNKICMLFLDNLLIDFVKKKFPKI